MRTTVLVILALAIIGCTLVFAAQAKQGFALRSSAVGADGLLPIEYTGFGDSVSPPLEWSGAPEGTKSYVLIMHHIDPQGATKVYWTLYNIPADTHSIAKNAKNIGTAGTNTINKNLGYAPPHSKGPGAKNYILTLYALSKKLEIAKSPQEITRQILLDAMEGCVLGKAELKATFSRPGTATDSEQLRPAAAGAGPGEQRPARAENEARNDDQRPPRPDDQAGAEPRERPQGQSDRPHGNENGPAPRDEKITEEQAAKVKEILSGYKSSTLTADQAKAIHEAFRNAGIHGGPALNDTIKAAGFDPDKLRDLAPPPGREGGQQQGDRGDRGANDNNRPPRDQGKGGGSQYSIEQAISDRAQLNTIAFDGLAFLTGDMGCNTFLPPGKVADYNGFQYMRDVDTNQLGHNTSFVPRAANNMLSILNDEQKAKLIALAKEQESTIKEFVYKRFPLIKAFCRLLDGDIPSGSKGLSLEAVKKYTAEFYALDGQLSYRRAEVLGGVVRSFTDSQKTALAKMVFNNSATWPEINDQVDKQKLSKTAHVAVMTYASEMFSWYAGNVEADVYFCPERHATYFGSFYMKDIPAMGNANYSISTSLTGDSGEAFLAALTETQRKLVTGLVDQQRADLNEIVKTRRSIATELRKFMKEPTIDKDKVMALSKRYGELDGEISYYYAVAFSKVGKTLTDDQKKTLLKLRNLDAKFICKGAYLYSQAIDMPEIPNTDFLFGVSKKD